MVSKGCSNWIARASFGTLDKGIYRKLDVLFGSIAGRRERPTDGELGLVALTHRIWRQITTALVGSKHWPPRHERQQQGRLLSVANSSGPPNSERNAAQALPTSAWWQTKKRTHKGVLTSLLEGFFPVMHILAYGCLLSLLELPGQQ